MDTIGLTSRSSTLAKISRVCVYVGVNIILNLVTAVKFHPGVYRVVGCELNTGWQAFPRFC